MFSRISLCSLNARIGITATLFKNSTSTICFRRAFSNTHFPDKLKDIGKQKYSPQNRRSRLCFQHRSNLLRAITSLCKIEFKSEQTSDRKPNDIHTTDQTNGWLSKSTNVVLTATAFASLVSGKAKFLIAALKIAKAGPLISMLISSAGYALFFGWPYAIGMVGLIFVHECGHAIVMNRFNIPFSPMVFIPFMGAVIVMEKNASNAYEEALIAFGGPVFGSIAAAITSAAGYLTDSQLLLALADWGYMINLFNLLPIGSMDGGRIANSISPYFGLCGVFGGCALAYFGIVKNPIFYLILIGGAYTSFTRITGWGKNDESKWEEFSNIGTRMQVSLLVAYLSLISALIIAMRMNDKYRRKPKELMKEAMSSDNSQESEYKEFFAFDSEWTGDHEDETFEDDADP